MLNNKLSGMSASKLRFLLIGTSILIILITAVTFWYIQGSLVEYAKQVQLSKASATTSASDVAQLKITEKILKDDKVAVTRAQSIVADSQHYQYQDQIIKDISIYAENNNVKLTGFTFDTDPSQSQTNSTPAASSAVDTAEVAPPLTTPNEVKSVSVSIGIISPVNYKNFLNFVHAIDLNLTKMQLSGITMSKAEKASDVTVGALTIEVYTK